MNRKPYVQKQPANWWLSNSYYRFYMIREATSVPVFLYALLLMWGIFSLTRGEAAFTDWLVLMANPYMKAFHLLALAASLLHAYTWFQLTPKILVIWAGKFRVPDSWVMIAHYGAFIVTSAVIFWLAISGLKG